MSAVGDMDGPRVAGWERRWKQRALERLKSYLCQLEITFSFDIKKIPFLKTRLSFVPRPTSWTQPRLSFIFFFLNFNFNSIPLEFPLRYRADQQKLSSTKN